MTQYTQQKKIRERQFLKYFQQSWPEFPKGRIEAGESPDFILFPKRNYRIGIEMTQLFLKKAIDGTHFIPDLETAKGLLLDAVKTQYEQQCDCPVTAHFQFSDELYFGNINIQFLAGEIADAVYNRVRMSRSNGYFHTRIMQSDNLPKCLHSITLIHHPEDKLSEWIYCKAQVPVSNFMLSIQQTIERKHAKIPIYQKKRLDQYWLLIVAECLNCTTSFNINNLIENCSFQSGFHQVFLFELFEQKIYLLNS